MALIMLTMELNMIARTIVADHTAYDMIPTLTRPITMIQKKDHDPCNDENTCNDKAGPPFRRPWNCLIVPGHGAGPGPRHGPYIVWT